MATVKEIYNYMETVVPVSMKMGSDNCGFLAGNSGTQVTKVLFALEITDEVIGEAKEYGAQLIIAHHPLLFSVTSVTDNDLVGRKLVALLNNGMSAICMHTNLDSVKGGVNDTLMQVLGIETEGIIDAYGADYGLGRYGTVPVQTLDAFLAHVKASLRCNGLRYISGGKPVQKVAVCGGSGSSYLADVAKLGCDTYVTADVKHNGFLDARDLGINLIDAGHYSTENVVVPVLKDMVQKAFPELETRISQVHTQPEQYYV